MSSGPDFCTQEGPLHDMLTSPDMFYFQCAFLGETVLADIRTVSAVRYNKYGIFEGTTSTNFCRVQIWREVECSNLMRSSTSSPDGSSMANYKGRLKGWMLRPKSSRIVVFLGRELLSVFSAYLIIYGYMSID